MNIRIDFLTFSPEDGLDFPWYMEIHAQSILAGTVIGRNIARNIENTTFKRAYNWNPEA